jgi:hypothetical protein
MHLFNLLVSILLLYIEPVSATNAEQVVLEQENPNIPGTAMYATNGEKPVLDIC